MLNFLWFLPIPQSQSGFLCMLTSHLQNLTITALGATHREPASGQPQGWGVWVGEKMSIRHAHWEYQQVRLMWPMDGLPDGVHKAANRHVFFICSKPWLLFSHPILPLSHTAHLSFLDGARKKWASLTAYCTAGEIRHSLSCSHFPLWEKSQDKKVSLGTEFSHLGGGVMQVK